MDERRIDVRGRELRTVAGGVGPPTVVLEAPAGGAAASWARVQPVVAGFARVLSYDRADGASLGASAAELAALLEATGEPGPYVLVGHSWGAAVVRAFAGLHPERVAGAVLVDPFHERLWPGALELMEPAARDRFRAEAPRLFWDPELTAELRASRFPAVPLVVLTAGHQPTLPPFVPADAVWRLWQAELIPHLVALSPRGVHLVADCGHDVPNEAPDAVVEAIRRVVEAARGDQDSAGGGATLPPI